MEIPAGSQHAFPKSLLLSASILALWVPQGSWAALRIQKIPEQPQMNQDLLLSVQGIPNTFQDFSWYLGEEAHGGTMLFTYIPKLLRPQRDGSAMNQRDIVGFSNGSMLLRHAQPKDSGTYQVAVTINPSWTMRAKTEVQVVEKPKELPVTSLPVSAGIVAAIVIGSLATGCIFVGSIAYLLVTRGWRAQNHRITATEKPELGPSHRAGKPEAPVSQPGSPQGPLLLCLSAKNPLVVPSLGPPNHFPHPELAGTPQIQPTESEHVRACLKPASPPLLNA
uniref:CEA cell adhesion molecule 19 n=1 Tax=Capra hircus TaxID=9925 RepID=A0A8C2RJ66_CAPHI